MNFDIHQLYCIQVCFVFCILCTNLTLNSKTVIRLNWCRKSNSTIIHNFHTKIPHKIFLALIICPVLRYVILNSNSIPWKSKSISFLSSFFPALFRFVSFNGKNISKNDLSRFGNNQMCVNKSVNDWWLKTFYSFQELLCS